MIYECSKLNEKAENFRTEYKFLSAMEDEIRKSLDKKNIDFSNLYIIFDNMNSARIMFFFSVSAGLYITMV